MVSTVFSIQAYIGIALSLAALGLELYAFVSAARSRAAAFPAVGRLTKNVWLLILGVAVLVTFYSGLTNPTGLLSLLGAAAAIYFLVDVRPKVRVTPERSGRDGPYSGW